MSCVNEDFCNSILVVDRGADYRNEKKSGYHLVILVGGESFELAKGGEVRNQGIGGSLKNLGLLAILGVSCRSTIQ